MKIELENVVSQLEKKLRGRSYTWNGLSGRQNIEDEGIRPHKQRI